MKVIASRPAPTIPAAVAAPQCPTCADAGVTGWHGGWICRLDALALVDRGEKLCDCEAGRIWREWDDAPVSTRRGVLPTLKYAPDRTSETLASILAEAESARKPA